MEHNLVDVHAHLDRSPLYEKIDIVIENAKKAGVKAIITSGLDTESNIRALDIAKKYPLVKVSLGVYPPPEKGLCHRGEKLGLQENLDFIKKNKDKIVAIGECGLDYQEGKDKDYQKEVFSKIIELSEKIKKPLIVHSRKAEFEIMEMLSTSKSKKIIMHCFCGRKHLVKTGYDRGYYFSIPTSIVRAQNFQIMSEIVDLNHLLTETDCPFLSPYKEKTNEPAFVFESVKKIAEIKKMELSEVENNIFMNFQKVF